MEETAGLVSVLFARIEKLEACMERMEELLSDALNVSVMLDRKDIAKRQGVCLSKVEREPWRCPDFGKSGVGGRRFQWHRDTVKEWEKRLDEHRQEWERMAIPQQLAARGIRDHPALPVKSGRRRTAQV